MKLSDEGIDIIGTGDGLVVSFKSKKWEEISALLYKKINENSSFFESGRVALDLGDCEVKAADLGKLRDEFSKRNISLWAILSTSDKTLMNVQTLGIPIQLGLKKAVLPKDQAPSIDGEPAVWIEKTLRAGQRVETKCHVIVMGDVNPGAEIISAGNIFVMGRLSGNVHAGAEGNDQAKVYALEFHPMQLRIANVTAALLSGKIKNQSEFAFIKDNEIVIKNWTSRKQI
jgi:septum site-determining protein MinC